MGRKAQTSDQRIVAAMARGARARNVGLAGLSMLDRAARVPPSESGVVFFYSERWPRLPAGERLTQYACGELGRDDAGHGAQLADIVVGSGRCRVVDVFAAAESGPAKRFVDRLREGVHATLERREVVRNRLGRVADDKRRHLIFRPRFVPGGLLTRSLPRDQRVGRLAATRPAPHSLTGRAELAPVDNHRRSVAPGFPV